MTAGKVRFRHDPLTPHETREMEKAGWERREDEDGGISWRQPGPVCTLFPEHGDPDDWPATEPPNMTPTERRRWQRILWHRARAEDTNLDTVRRTRS